MSRSGATVSDSLAATGFFRLWAAESISLAGAQITVFALPLVAVLILDANAWQMGLLGAAGSLAALLFGLSVGVWSDQYERQMLMLVANGVRMIALLLVPVLYWQDLLTLPILAIVALTVGAMTLLFDSAMSSYLPRLVGRGQLGPANSWMQGTQAVGDVGGPGVAGLLVQVVGAPATLLVDSGSYLVSSAALLTLPRAAPETDVAVRDRHGRAILNGLKLLWRHPILRPLALSAAHFNLFTSMFFALYVLYVVRELHFSPFLLGICTMFGGVGGLAAASVTTWLGRRFGMGRVLMVCYSGPGFAGLLVPAASAFPKPAAAVLIGGSTMLWSGFVVVLMVLSMTMKQSLVEDSYLGRTTATFRFIAWGIEPFGALIGGALGSSALGLRGTMIFATVGLLLAASWTFLSEVRRFRDIAPPTGDPEGPLPGDANRLPVTGRGG